MILEFLLYWVVLPLLVFGVIFSFIRLLQSPSLPGRVIALDMMSVLGIGIIVVYAVVTNQPVFVDVASVFCVGVECF